MSSSSSTSSSDETPRPQEHRFQDFDFFDSDDDGKVNNKRSSEANSDVVVKHHTRKDLLQNELHGQGIKRGTSEKGNEYKSVESLKVKKTHASYTQHSLEKHQEETDIIFTKHKMKQMVRQKELMSSPENKEKVTVHVPHEGSFHESESEYDSSSSVTDVSPLQSPNATPRARRKNVASLRKTEKKVQSKTKFVIKENVSQDNEERPHARRANGETLSVEDLFYSSDGTPVSSGERETLAERKRKVQRKKRNRYDEIQHRMEASSRHHRRRLLDVAAQNSMDISQLLEVVLEMEQENKDRRMYANRGSRNISPSPIKPTRKKNMSFSNEQVRDIDRENGRLLKRLSQLCANPQQSRPSSASSVRSAASSVRSRESSNRSRRPMTATGMRSSPSQGPRQYHSATNRLREQQRIERENLAFLKRLQSARASSNLRRDNLLRDYHKQTGRTLEPVRPRRKQRNGFSHREENFDPRPAWQDSW